MSEFQITFRGVLPEPNLRALAEAMYHKVRGRYGRTSRFHLAVVEQPSAHSTSHAVTARVQLHAGPSGASVAAEAWNENPVAAVRAAFAQAYIEMHNTGTEPVRISPRFQGVRPRLAKRAAEQAGKLLLFRRPA